MKSLRLIAFLVISLAPMSVLAQTVDNDQLMQRIDRLENDIQLLQKQVSTGAPPSAGYAPASGSDAASLDVQISNLQDEMRSLRGQMEENQFQIRKVADALDKLQKDTEFRFSQLSNTASPAAVATVPNAVPPATGATPGLTTAGDGMLHPPATPNDTDNGTPPTDSATPRDHYNYAFRLLNQTQYPEAAAAFDSFIKKYPKDPLIGNAYYWEGETYYIRHDYTNAADNFRQGFEALPDGPKAPDNLFKLALSLDAMNRDKEACVVLQQITAKFKKSSASLAQRADQEQKRIGCQ